MRTETGSNKPCPHCGISEANQHSLRQSGICDGIRKGVLKRVGKDDVVKVEPETK